MIVDTSALIAILCNTPKALFCATDQSFEPPMRHADVPSIAELWIRNHGL
jgi:hypothetical protein